MKSVFLFLLLFLALAPCKVLAQYEIMFSNGYPPYNYLNEKGELVGFNIDITNAIKKLSDSDINISGDNWNAINEALDKGEIQAIGGTHYPGGSDDNYIYTRSAINTSHCFFYNKKRFPNFSLEYFRSLKEPLVALWKNDVLEYYTLSINPSAKFLYLDDYERLIKTLDRDDVTCIFGQRVGSMYYADKLGKNYLRPLEHRILERNMGFKVSKDAPELAKLLNNGLEVILANGEYQRIYDQWISPYNRNYIDWKYYLKYILIAGILIVLIFLLLVFANRILQARVRRKTKDLQQQLALNSEIMQELEKQKVKAEESDKMKSAFLANMSHEIRTPMNGILGFADLLKDPELSGIEQQQYISVIEKSGARMLNIINDIISISKIESGQVEVKMQDGNINEQIEYIYAFFDPEVEAKGMLLSFDIAMSDSDALIKTDHDKLYSVLINLVKNAIKYSEKGTIKFGYNVKGDFLEYYVKDTGIGIPKDRQEAVFERFVQADIADKMARQGAGLGLAISKAFVEMLGGKIWLESEQTDLLAGIEGGSTFWFTIPFKRVGAKDKMRKKELLPLDEINLDKQFKILVAEDDEPSRILISMVVKKFGREIIYTRTGQETVEACRTSPDIELVLMDIQMPEMNGYEATREIRKFNRDIIIIAQTAYALTGDREKALEAGCNDYISKPIDKNKLGAMIGKHLK